MTPGHDRQQRRASRRRIGRGRLPGEPLADRRSQRLLDVAVMKQALLDMRLRTDGFRMKRMEQEACIDQMLDAARWLFTNWHPGHVFNPERICQRLGVDTRKLAQCVFEALPAERQAEIRARLEHYQCSLLPAA
jgi:hypothetical protein